MLNNRPLRILGLIFLVTVVAFYAYVNFHSAFHTCIDQAADTYSQQHQNAENETVAVPFMYGFGTCANLVARHDGEAITALSTALLTFVTLGLVLLGIEQSDTSRAELRAYVLHDTADLIDGTNKATPVSRANQPGAVIRIRNFGQTPAYAVKHTCRIDVAPIGDADKMVTGILETEALHGAVLAPGVGMVANRWLNRPLTAVETTGIFAGTHAIFVYGRIEYRDAWKQRRWATYRLQYETSIWPPAIEPAGMDFSSEGNNST